MLFIELLTQSWITCTILIPCKIRFILLVNQRTCDSSDGASVVNWNVLARMSIMNHQHPSSYNIRKL